MKPKRNEFLDKLVATFKIEANEHLQAICSGLIELEATPEVGRQPDIVESVFREAHSLKGAARAVNRIDVEEVCQYLETELASLKRGEKTLSPDAFDEMHHLLDRVAEMLGSSESARRPRIEAHAAEIGGEQPAEVPAEMDRTSPVETPEPAEPIAAARTGEASAVAVAEPVSPAEESRRAARGASNAKTRRMRTSDTVRISTSKLDSLLLQAEEMVSVKLTAAQRAAELRQLEAMHESWKKSWAKMYPEMRALRQFIETHDKRRGAAEYGAQWGKVLEFLDWNSSQMQAQESKVAVLSKYADHDHRSFGSMVDNLLEDMKKVLMLPFSSLLEIFPKQVRDLSRDQGKDVELVMQGADIEIDRRILEEMKDPLIHIVRNCIDHGIEKPQTRAQRGKPARARLTIGVSQADGNNVEILIADDGAGIDVPRVKSAAVRHRIVTQEEADKMSDAEALSLIFQSEVSTSPIITDLSGRGLGLAIVREKVEKLGGLASVQATPGQGTTFRLLLPLTLATFRGILVQSAGQLFVVPTANVERVTRVAREAISSVESRATITLNGRSVSMVSLQRVLELPEDAASAAERDYVQLLVVGSGDKRIAFGIDEVLHEQEVLVKSLGRNLERVRNIAAATVLGTGRVVPILSVPDLLKSATRLGAEARRASSGAEAAETKRHSILIAEDSITSRMLLKNILESASYDVKATVDGMDAFTALKNEEFDLVVSDVEMPRMSGFDLVAKMRADKKLALVPVVLVTSLESREHRERGIEVGANAYIVKSSFDQSNLLDVVQKLI